VKKKQPTSIALTDLTNSCNEQVPSFCRWLRLLTSLCSSVLRGPCIKKRHSLKV